MIWSTIVLFWSKVFKAKLFQGQGVIEYAGALVISIFIVAMVLGNLPEYVYQFVVDIQEQILAFLLTAVQEIG